MNRRVLSMLGCGFLIAALLIAGIFSQNRAEAQGTASDKLVLAFYYMWYGPGDFDRGTVSDKPPYPYISNRPEVIDRQVSEARGAGIDAFISSWSGGGGETERNFPLLLEAAKSHDFRATIYFETNSAMQHGDVAAQLQQFLGKYSSHPAFLRWRGQPVVFFWSPQSLGGSAAWREVRRKVDPNNTQIWSVDTTDPSYLDVFDTVHLFSAGKWNTLTDVAEVDRRWRATVDAYNKAHGTTRLWTAGVIPGWDETHVQPPRNPAKLFPRRNGAMYDESWLAAIASNPEWVTITSYNEWFEGTQIEPSASYGNRYLDLTRQYTSLWKGSSNPCSGGTPYPQTGHSICRAMESYWHSYGGLAQFGYPISEPAAERSPTDGKTYTVQYFERARFELHPESPNPDYAVMLGLLGRQFHNPDPPATPLPGRTYFKETGHNVSAAFNKYWQAHGGLFVNGFPISEEFQEKASDGKTYTVQYFERARYELHPENTPPYNILLGALGRLAHPTP